MNRSQGASGDKGDKSRRSDRKEGKEGKEGKRGNAKKKVSKGSSRPNSRRKPVAKSKKTDRGPSSSSSKTNRRGGGRGSDSSGSNSSAKSSKPPRGKKPSRNSRDEGAGQSVEKRLSAVFRDRKYRPRNKTELSRLLNLEASQRDELGEALKSFLQRGLIEGGKHGRYRIAGTPTDRELQKRARQAGAPNQKRNKAMLRKTKLLQSEGKLVPGRGGEIYFEPDQSREDGVELFVAQRDRAYALPGDRVIAEIKEGPVPSYWRRIPSRKWMVRESERTGEPCRWARVVKVIERSEQGIVGSYQVDGKYYTLQPDSSLYPETIDLSAEDVKKFRVSQGDKIVVNVESWPKGQQYPHAKIVKRIGSQGEAGVDILSIFYKHGLRADFPPPVLKETERIPAEVDKADLTLPADREDWRKELIITIDPVDAKDFDDAISVKKLESGGWQLAVHIADVSHYVRPGSALDKESQLRGNSTYLADRVVPMLPEKLSNGLCSLVEGKDRLTACAVIEYDAAGKRKSFRFCKAVIHSAKRLSYEQAMERLKKPDLKDPIDALIVESWSLASILRKLRFKEGAFNLEMPEIRAVLDKEGVPIELKRSVHDESHELIEEFMLAANQVVALHLKREAKPALYRVHDDPDAEKLFELRELLATFGIRVGDLTNRHEIQKALDAAAQMPESHAIKLSVLKSMKRAAYDVDALGHYGLAFKDYTHFTSPIRRYADLLVHRSLFGLNKGKLSSYGELKQIATHLSRTERASGAAEMESQKLKQLEYFLNIVNKEPQTSFAGVVTGVERMGVFVELHDSMLRGLVRNVDMPQDMQRFDPARKCYGKKGSARSLSLGDEVSVKILRVDGELMRIDFSLRDWK